MGADEVRLRVATPDDVGAGAELHRRCWAETYRGIADPAALEPRLADRDRWVAAWRRQLAEGPAYTVAEVGGALVGFALVGRSRMVEAPTPTELHALYVRRSHHGTGLGARLLDAVLRPEPCMVWVTEANARARAFYARHGFEPDGTRQLYDGLGAWECRLVRPADPDRAARPAP